MTGNLSLSLSKIIKVNMHDNLIFSFLIPMSNSSVQTNMFVLVQQAFDVGKASKGE